MFHECSLDVCQLTKIHQTIKFIVIKKHEINPFLPFRFLLSFLFLSKTFNNTIQERVFLGVANRDNLSYRNYY